MQIELSGGGKKKLKAKKKNDLHAEATTCYYAQMWRLCTCTDKTYNISMLDLSAPRER